MLNGVSSVKWIASETIRIGLRKSLLKPLDHVITQETKEN